MLIYLFWLGIWMLYLGIGAYILEELAPRIWERRRE